MRAGLLESIYYKSKLKVCISVSSIANFVLVMSVPLMKMARIPETLIAAVSCAMCCVGFGVVTVARSFTLITVGR